MKQATATATPNLALVKYWGKRDSNLILPAAGSLSLTLDIFPTTTTVEVREDLRADDFSLNGITQTGVPAERVTQFLRHVRELAGSNSFARVTSHNEAPTAAGLASSASGFAALATAASAAYGLDLSQRDLSRLARRGSGSACRSVIPRVAVWHAGNDDETSFAEEVAAPAMAMVILVVDGAKKAVSSREAMRSTARTSPFYAAWITSTEATLREMLEACATDDFARIGEITELNALRMHATIQACDPPIRYLAPRSVAAFDRVAELRNSGVPAYATADAGPNVAVLTRPEYTSQVAAALQDLGTTHIAHAGQGAHLLTTGEESS